ncbi:hypothetical protein O181_036367 [Austropuccinia psidii MF-1]|uniref:Chromo domain-containing protein n=1 Tax=Austropuccinia psidii MF-1 TaxID=1389203 RepID=A0A9Q3DAL3_9BASI|nr:hypothetical protein [Austropuccinia psidii MF-1]
MTISWRKSPFMDDQMKSKPPPLHQDWRKDLFDVCVQTGRSCVIFTNLQMVAGQSGGAESGWTDRAVKSDSRTVALDVYSPVGKLSTKLQSVQQVIKEELESEICRIRKYADRNRSIPPDFQSRDKVWLASKNINTTRPTKKPLERWVGPFEVLKKIGIHEYHIKLLQLWKSVHPVFHVSLLEPVKQSTIPSLNQLPPPPVIMEEQEEWEVGQFLDSKLKRGKLQYLVEWERFSEELERTTGEPASNLTNSTGLVNDFHSLYPHKPSPITSRV